VKLWQDEAGGAAAPRWRGQVTGVADGEKAYAARADEVPVLLARELTRAGIRLGWAWRLRVMLYERRRARRGQG
jgi:hypothetical protein